MTYKDIKMPSITEEEIIEVVTQFNQKFAKEHYDEVTPLYDRVSKTKSARNDCIWILIFSLMGVFFLYLFWYGWLCKDVSSFVPGAKWCVLLEFLFTIGFVAGLIALGLHVVSRVQNKELNELYKKITKEYEENTGLSRYKTTPARFIQDLMWAFEMWNDAENDADFMERVDADRRESLQCSIQKYVMTKDFSFLDMIQKLRKLSDEYEYMCVMAGEEKSKLLTPFLLSEECVVLFQGFRDGVVVNDVVVHVFVPGKEYVGRASHGDFTFIDEIVAKIRIAYC